MSLEYAGKKLCTTTPDISPRNGVMCMLTPSSNWTTQSMPLAALFHILHLTYLAAEFISFSKLQQYC